MRRPRHVSLLMIGILLFAHVAVAQGPAPVGQPTGTASSMESGRLHLEPNLGASRSSTGQDPLGPAMEAERAGLSQWSIGGFAFIGIGAAMCAWGYQSNKDAVEQDATLENAGLAFVGVGLGIFVAGLVKNSGSPNRAFGVSPRRGGVAVGGVIRWGGAAPARR